MLYSQRLRNGGPDPGGLALKQSHPSGIVVDKHNAAIQRLRVSDMGGANVFVGPRLCDVCCRRKQRSFAGHLGQQ